MQADDLHKEYKSKVPKDKHGLKNYSEWLEKKLIRIYNRRERIEKTKGFDEFLSFINTTFNKRYRQTELYIEKFNARLADGFTLDDFKRSITNASKDEYHIGTRFKYLTPEFFCRPDKLDKFINNSEPIKLEDHPNYNQKIQNQIEYLREQKIPLNQNHLDYLKATDQK